MLHTEIVSLALFLRQLDADFAVGAQSMLVLENLLLYLLIAATGAAAKMLPCFPWVAAAVALEPFGLFLSFIHTFHGRCLRNLRMRMSMSARSSAGSLPWDHASSCLRSCSASSLSHLSSLTSCK